ncbi:MAG: type VI secretion system tip protein TssI/VgrG, partial [Pseudomonadota bacterium]
QIIEKIFTELGFTDYQLSLTGSYQPCAYCVQYRESSFNFVSRLMEQEGIFYFFDHQRDKHILILGDSPSAYLPCKGKATVRFHRGEVVEEDDTITEWHEARELRAGRVALKDFNFETPKTDLTVNQDSLIQVGGNPSFEIYDSFGEYHKRGEGDRYANLRMEEEESHHALVQGEGVHRGFSPGFTFTLDKHPVPAFNRRYVLASVMHSGGNNYLTPDGGSSYSNSFTNMPDDAHYRPTRLTPKPVVQGPQTAIVVGPKGEEIHTDKYGRVKVQFYWDREGHYNEKSSCWVRVSQNWAGRRWGAMFLPRIGQEVIISYLEGDPDHPIITGRVYNADEMPPYSLPGEQTKSTLKSYSSKGGGGFNELRFEDQKGQEQVFLHAERQQDNRVKEDSLEWVGQDRHLIVKQNQLEEVGGTQNLTVKGAKNEEVQGKFSLKADQDLHQKVGMNLATEAGMNIHIKAGMNLVIESQVMLTLKVGGNFIALSPANIAIQGTMVLINSGGSPGEGAGAQPDAPQSPKEADDAQPGGASSLPPDPTPPLRKPFG